LGRPAAGDDEDVEGHKLGRPSASGDDELGPDGRNGRPADDDEDVEGHKLGRPS
jgi:hypothetical protein